MFRICFLLLMMCGAAEAQTYVGSVRVVDGDTIDIGLAQNIRLHGIDAPELAQTCGAFACGRAAHTWLNKQIGGKRVTCTQMAWDSRYGRPVARCETADGRDIARMMVVRGYAWAYLKYSNDYALDEKAAAALAKRGVWAHSFESPAKHRAAQVAIRQDTGCKVKGNISPNSGERIYHIAGQQHFNKVRIDPSKGEQCFATEAEAQAAGWRKARR